MCGDDYDDDDTFQPGLKSFRRQTSHLFVQSTSISIIETERAVHSLVDIIYIDIKIRDTTDLSTIFICAKNIPSNA